MADYLIRHVRIDRTEYLLSSPTNWTEIRKVIAGLEQDLPAELAQWDNTVIVEARDDEIVFWYETKSDASTTDRRTT